MRLQDLIAPLVQTLQKGKAPLHGCAKGRKNLY